MDTIDAMDKRTSRAPREGISEDLDVKNHELCDVINK